MSFAFDAATGYRVDLSDGADGPVAADAIYVVADPGPVSGGTFTWEPTIPASGSYKLYARVPALPEHHLSEAGAI